MKTGLAFLAGVLACACCVSAAAQNYKPFPGQGIDQPTLRMQERVEQLYTSGDYDRALLIYEKELAPLGDKYAQYMVGYMHLNAQGVPQDRVEALAWYQLAAERGEPALKRVQDELRAQLSDVEIGRARQIFLDLWKRIGDRKLIMELIRRDMDTLRERTGTRIPGSRITSPTIIITPSGEQIGPDYYRDILARLEARLAYLETRVEIVDFDNEAYLAEMRNLEQNVRAEVASRELP